jgi:flagellar basal-body rod protein FlgC
MQINSIGSKAFSTFGISASGLGVHKLWLDAVADNVANINTIRPTNQPAFQERFVTVENVEGGGVRTAGAAFGNADGILVYNPNHAMADENGMVRQPDINLSDQMVYMIEAQRAYQANAAVYERARAAYEAMLTIGRG